MAESSGGAGPVHRWCGKEDALPELPLVIRHSQGNFTADPQCVAEHHAQEWKREWSSEDALGFDKEISGIRGLRELQVEEAREWAGNLDLRSGNVRKACLSFLVQDGTSWQKVFPFVQEQHLPTWRSKLQR